MGVNFMPIVLITFAIGSGLAAFAGLINGLYYNEINFGMGLYLGVIGLSAAIIGGFGSIYGAILGGFLFAGLQTLGRSRCRSPAPTRTSLLSASSSSLWPGARPGSSRKKSASGSERVS